VQVLADIKHEEVEEMFAKVRGRTAALVSALVAALSFDASLWWLILSSCPFFLLVLAYSSTRAVMATSARRTSPTPSRRRC
jgi:Zn-dependent protease with chaperone function